MLYTMRRTQLYLDEILWDRLRTEARARHTTVSDLVRKALREKYVSSFERRRKAMEAVVGIWKDRTDLPDTDEYIRSMRRNTRAERLR